MTNLKLTYPLSLDWPIVHPYPVFLSPLKRRTESEETKRLDKPEEGEKQRRREEVAKCPQMEFEIGDLTDDGEDDRGGHGWHGGRLRGHPY